MVFKKSLTVWDLGSALVLTGLVFTGMWAHLDVLGLPAWVLLAGVFGFSWWCLRQAGWPVLDGPSGPVFQIQKPYLIASSLFLLPTLVYLLISWGWEFPFGGDHDHHVMATQQATAFWNAQWGWALIILGGSIYGLAKAPQRQWPWVLLAVTLGASFTAQIPPHYFERYPASLYTLTAPLFQLADIQGWDSLFNPGRFMNFLAPVLWLLVLRPLIFRKTELNAWMVLAAFALLQKEYIFHFDSVYLESWALIFILLAIESLFTEDSPAWTTALLAGVACTFKDSTLLAFPFFGLAALLKAGRSSRARFLTLAAGALGILPFAIYYIARIKGNVWRTTDVSNMSEAFDPIREQLFIFRIGEQYHLAGWIGFTLLFIAGLVLAYRNKTDRSAAAILFFGGTAQYLFFFVDKISKEYTGLPRLHLLPTLMLLAPLFAAARRMEPKRQWALTAVIIALQLPALLPFFKQSLQPSSMQSLTEDYGFAFYHPIRTLIEKAQLRPGQSIRIAVPNPATHLQVFPLIYRDLVKRYRIQAGDPAQNPLFCQCQADEALLIPLPRPINLHARFPHPPYSATLNTIPPQCMEAARASCSNCIADEHPGIEPLGLICQK